jgi:hypothetical protein
MNRFVALCLLGSVLAGVAPAQNYDIDPYVTYRDPRYGRLWFVRRPSCGRRVIALGGFTVLGLVGGYLYYNQAGWVTAEPTPPAPKTITVVGPSRDIWTDASPSTIPFRDLVIYQQTKAVEIDTEAVQRALPPEVVRDILPQAGARGGELAAAYGRLLYGDYDPYHRWLVPRKASSFFEGQSTYRGDAVAKAVLLYRLLQANRVACELTIVEPNERVGEALKLDIVGLPGDRISIDSFGKHAIVELPDGIVADPALNYYGRKDQYYRDFVRN